MTFLPGMVRPNEICEFLRNELGFVFEISLKLLIFAEKSQKLPC